MSVKEFDTENVKMIAYFPEESRFQAMDINDNISEIDKILFVDCSEGIKVEYIFAADRKGGQAYLSNKTEDAPEKIMIEIMFSEPVRSFTTPDNTMELRPKQ